MTEELAQPASQLRRRLSSGNPNLPLNLEVGYQVSEGGPSQGTPSPGCIRFVGSSKDSDASLARREFRKKQESFVIKVEECEEELIVMESDDEGCAESNEAAVARAVTPTPIQDFAANVVYTEGPQLTDFLKVKTLEQDCLTDVSDAGSEEEE